MRKIINQCKCKSRIDEGLLGNIDFSMKSSAYELIEFEMHL